MWNEDDSFAKAHLSRYPDLWVARFGTLVQVVGRLVEVPRHLLWHESIGHDLGVYHKTRDEHGRSWAF